MSSLEGNGVINEVPPSIPPPPPITFSRPSFAADETATMEMRMAVGRIMESLGFTHSHLSCIDLVTDIGIRYMRTLSDRIRTVTDQAGRTQPTMRDLELSYDQLNIDVDEMNSFMRQVREVPGRDVALFPVKNVPSTSSSSPSVSSSCISYSGPPPPITYTPVPSSLRLPLPSIAFPGVPPMNSLWLKDGTSGVGMDEENGPSTSKDVTSSRVILSTRSLPGMDALPDFSFLTAHSTGLRKAMTTGIEKKVVKPEKRKNESRLPSLKLARNNSSLSFDTTTPPVSSHSNVPNLSIPSPAISSRSLQSTQPLSPGGIPLAASVAPTLPEYTYTQTDPLLASDLIQKSEEIPEQDEDMELIEEEAEIRVASPIPLDESTLYGPLPDDVPPSRIIQLAVLRSLFALDRPLGDELREAFAHIRGVRPIVEEPPPPPPPPAPVIPPTLPPLRLKINIAPPPENYRPRVEEGGNGDMNGDEDANGSGVQDEGMDDQSAHMDETVENGAVEEEETKSKKKSHKKHKKHKKKRSRNRSMEGSVDSPVSNDRPLTPATGIKLKIRLGPKPQVE